MRQKIFLAEIFVLFFVIMVIIIPGSAAADSIQPLLKTLVDEIIEVYQKANCDQTQFESDFKDFKKKYYGGKYASAKIEKLPPKYNPDKSKDQLQVHDITKANNFPADFPSDLLKNGGRGLPYALHFNRYYYVGDKMVADVHVIFWVENNNRQRYLCVMFWEKMSGKITGPKRFPLSDSDCNSLDSAKDWVEKNSPEYAPVYELLLTPTQEWQTQETFEEFGMSYWDAKILTNWVKATGTAITTAVIMRYFPELLKLDATLNGWFINLKIPAAQAHYEKPEDYGEGYNPWGVPQIIPDDPENTGIGDNYINLRAATSLSASSSQKPELFVSELKLRNGKTKYYDDETVHLDAYVKNGGKSVASKIDKISLKLYRFKGEKENGDTKEIDSENIKGENLGSGKKKHEEFSFGAPGTEDKYQVYAVIDTKNAVSESNEKNNRSGTISFRVHKRPDIRVDDLRFKDKQVVFQLDEIPKARATFINTGGEPFQDVPVRWYIDGKHFADDNMRHWNIEHGDEKHEEINLVKALFPGRHTLKVCADLSEDKRKSDNCKELAFEVKNEDLSVSVVELTNTEIPVSTDSLYGAAMTIQNNGVSNLKDGFLCSYEIKGPSTDDQWAMVAEEIIEEDELPIGVEITKETSTLIQAPAIPGNYELRACADYQDTITETEESNNCATATFEVGSGKPDLTILKIGFAGGKMTLKQNEKFGLCASVSNQGSVPALDNFFNGYYLMPPGSTSWQYSDDIGSSFDNPCVECAYEECTRTDSFVADIQGAWKAKICADVDTVVEESNEDNNCSVFSFQVASLPAPMAIKITDPEKGEKWSTNNNHTINWSTANIPSGKNVKIEYSLDGGNKWFTLTSSTNNDGSKKWDMEDSPYNKIITKDTDKAMIRITLVENPSVKVTSEKFKIDHKK